MKVAKFLQSHKRSLFLLLVILVIGGIGSCFKVPLSLFPHVDFPRVVVSVDVGDRPADLMAIQVTWPLEEAVRSVPGVIDVRSTTSRGSAEISIKFNWGMDMISAMLQVESAIHLISNLPPGTKLDVRRMDPTVFPVIAYSLISNVHSLVDLRDIAIYQLKPILSTISGVAKVGVIGGAPEEYRVILDIPKLISYGVSINDVAKALSADNILTAVGRLEEYYKLYLLTSDTRLENIFNIKNTVLRSGQDGIILIEDVADISRTIAPHWTRVTSDEKDAIILQIYQQPDQNTIQIDNNIKNKLKELPTNLINGIEYKKWYDQSELILSSTKGVIHAIIFGIILSSIIIFGFLRNLKVTLLAIIALPAVLSIAILIMYLLNMSFNIMTLGGIAAAVGLIVDDAIVMIEHIIRRFREDPTAHQGKVLEAAKQFTKPLAGSSISTIIIFVPLVFFSGVTGSFFKVLSLTMAISLIISFFIAWLVIPIFADHFLNEKDANQKEGSRYTERIHQGYEKIMKLLFQTPSLILFIIIPLIVIAFFGYKNVGSGFMPKMDEGGFIIDYVAPPGTSLTETDRLLHKVEMILQANPAIQTYSRRTGLQLGGGVTEASEGDFFVRLKPNPRAKIEKVMDDVRQKIEASTPILSIELSQLMEDLIGDLTSVPEPIEIKLFSDQASALQASAQKVADAIRKMPGIVDVKNGIVFAGDALDIKVDRVKSSLEGMDPESVTQILKSYLSGIVTTQIQQGPKMVDVRVWIADSARASKEDVENLLLRAPDGHQFPLKRIATIMPISGQPQIKRDNLKQMIPVTGRISGKDMGSVLNNIKQMLKQSGMLTNGVYYELGGLYAEQQAAFKVLTIVFIFSVLLMFLLLLFLYDNFAVVLASLFTTLLAGSAVFIGLWLTSTELNISSLMGLTMVIGIATKMSIFYFSELFGLTKELNDVDVFIKAGKGRMRPIIMTSFVTILALFPLAIYSGMQQPLAIAIISGLIVELPLVLIVLPVILSLFYKFSKRSSP